MTHDAQPSGFNLVLDMVDIISLIINLYTTENCGRFVNLSSK